MYVLEVVLTGNNFLIFIFASLLSGRISSLRDETGAVGHNFSSMCQPSLT